MKILCIVPSYKPAYIYGGPVRSIASLCEALVTRGHDVTVYTTTANGKAELNVEPGKAYQVDGVNVHYFKRQTKGHSNFSLGLFNALNKSASTYDIIHIHSWWNFIAVISAAISLRNRIVPVISPRGTLTPYSFTHRNKFIKQAFHHWIGEKILRKCVLHVTSNEEKSGMQQFVSSSRIYSIPNLLDLPTSAQGEHSDEPFLKLIFIGRIHPVKNLEMLFQALRQITSFPYQLQIIGEGEIQYVDSLKSRTADMPFIHWMGNIDGDEKFKLLANADLLVLPSHTENYGNVVLEALSQGTPVLISTNVGAKDYIVENDLGWVIEGKENLWQNALISIWADKTFRSEIRQRAVVCIARDFDSKVSVKDYINMYEQYIDKHRPVIHTQAIL